MESWRGSSGGISGGGSFSGGGSSGGFSGATLLAGGAGGFSGASLLGGGVEDLPRPLIFEVWWFLTRFLAFFRWLLLLKK